MPYTLAAQTRQRQVEAIRRSDRVAGQAERAVHEWWRDLLALLHAGPQLGLTRLHALALVHFRRLPSVTRTALRDGLMGLYVWGAESARRGVLRAVPKETLRRMVAERVRTPDLARSRFRLTEDRAPPSPLDYLFAVGRFPALPEDVPDDLLLSLVLPTPPVAVIRQRVERLIAPFLAAPRPDLAPPEMLANVLVREYSQGKTQQEIAKALLPHADGVRSSARRVARTWGIYVAGESQREAHESLGDLVIGYEVRASPGPYSRPWHQERSGTIYYKQPKQGQKGLAQMPRPPLEAEDPGERPAGTPRVAWNCLCYLMPVLAPVVD